MVSKCLILDAITLKKKVRLFFSLRTELRAQALEIVMLLYESSQLFCSLVVMCSILNICVHSFIIHSNKNLSWKQRDSPPSSTPNNQHLLPACELILEPAGVCLWSQPAACVCVRELTSPEEMRDELWVWRVNLAHHFKRGRSFSSCHPLIQHKWTETAQDARPLAFKIATILCLVSTDLKQQHVESEY